MRSTLRAQAAVRAKSPGTFFRLVTLRTGRGTGTDTGRGALGAGPALSAVSVLLGRPFLGGAEARGTAVEAREAPLWRWRCLRVPDLGLCDFFTAAAPHSDQRTLSVNTLVYHMDLLRISIHDPTGKRHVRPLIHFRICSTLRPPSRKPRNVSAPALLESLRPSWSRSRRWW